ncbi:MAG: HAD-IG family 5'-nucleotidase [Deltaproteobacteria bacterium]|nr:HAD-IG family 5'-nucleotidase [Deltaproteobacteria bacterium]
MGATSRKRRIFANRTLNFRGIKAVGYDMDYTIIHYLEREWEKTAYSYALDRLRGFGWPLDGLTFDPALMIRGLVIDTELGNIVKANRFGFINRAFHGTRALPFDETKSCYARTIVDLSDRRFQFMNTLFSLSEACLYAQLVELFDNQKLSGVSTYDELYRRVRTALDVVHMEGRLKAEIALDPDRFVDLDPETALAIIDQRHADKKLVLITNSEWAYTRALMTYAFDRYLPSGTTWRDLFDITIVEARKPDFFLSRNAVFEVVSEDGLLRSSATGIRPGGTYVGGSADLVEKALGLAGEEILYVGDHIFSDVHVTKNILRWRTALILRELEDEIEAIEAFAPQMTRLEALMARKSALEHAQCQLRIRTQRRRFGYDPVGSTPPEEIQVDAGHLREQLDALDEQIAPLAQSAAELGNRHWGLLLRAGNDKSQLARQMERYADIYTSRVSNFAFETPFAYLRSVRGTLPHDDRNHSDDAQP